MWRLPEAHTASTGILSRITGLSYFRNGSELRKMLPLWMLPETHIPSTDVLGLVPFLSSFRNGTE